MWEKFVKASAIQVVILVLIIAGALAIAIPRLSPIFATPGKTYYVAPGGNDDNIGDSSGAPFASIQKAIDKAQPGDTVTLADGAYYQQIQTVRNGRKRSRITIKGGPGATLYGSDASNRVLVINHDYITISGFHIDGQSGDGEAKEDYRDKLVYVIGNQPRKGVTGLIISGMTIENGGGECVRLRYFAKDNEVKDSTIRNCGIYDFKFGDGGKNGEGIYIGTAPEQRADGKNPTKDVDRSSGNHIHGNVIQTHGNECVDIKEGATKNIVEYNTCQYQSDPKSGGFDARGDYNIIRHNTITDNVGAGVRLGGDTPADGLHNDVYNNKFANDQGGVLKIERMPQGKICENDISGDIGKIGADINPTASCDSAP